MKTFTTFALAATLLASAAPALAETDAAVPVMTEVKRGDMLYSAEGRRIANVYSVTEAGDAKIIYRGKMVTISVDTLSDVDGKLTTTLTRADLKK